MTAKELNRDIKRLRKIANIYSGTTFDEPREAIIKKELLRLYNADRSFEYMNKESVLTMFRLNLRFRAVALHSFGGYWEL